MALIKCPDCGKMFSDRAEKCPACGCPVEHARAIIQKEEEERKREEERRREEERQLEEKRRLQREEEERKKREVCAEENRREREKRAERKAYIQKNKGKVITCVVLALLCISGIIYWAVNSHRRTIERVKQEEMAQIAKSDSIHRADSIRNEEIRKEKELEEAKKEAAIEFIKDFYNTYKYGDNSFLKEHCSASMLKKLRDYYEYDCEDDDCLAEWVFCYGHNGDGPNNKYGVIDVTPLGENWYRYEFYDEGLKGSHDIKIIVENDKFIIDDLKD